MTNVAKWAWQAPRNIEAGHLDPEKYWCPGTTPPHPEVIAGLLSEGWRFHMRLNNGQRVTARAK